MKKSPLLAAVAACLLVLAMGVALAPAQRTGPVGSVPANKAVALVNLSYIFKNHVRFKSMMQELEGQMKEAEKRIEDEKKLLEDRRAEMKQYEKGSPEYKNLEREITQRLADLQVLVAQQREEFLKRQGQIHHSIYQEVYKEIDYYAQQNGIGAVIRFAHEPVDPDKPEDVLRHINKRVIWYSPSQDITGIILDRLNGPAAQNPQNLGGRDYRLPLH